MKKVSWLLIVVSVLTLLALRSNSSVIAQDGGDSEANKAVLLAFFEAEAARDYDRMDEFFVEDFVRHSVATTAVMPEVQVTSREQYVQFLQATVAMFPDYYNTPQLLIGEGDYVAFFTAWSGAYAENGNWIEVPMSGYVRFENGKIAEMWIEWDNLTWNTQMMAPPAETTERPIMGIEDIVGTWRTFSEAYGWASFSTFTEQGFSYPGMVRGCAPDNCFDRARFVVEGNQIHFLTSETYPDCGEAVYEAFVVSQNGVPIGLRLELVGEDCYLERVEAYDGKIVHRVSP